MTGAMLYLLAMMGLGLWVATSVILSRLPRPTNHRDFQYRAVDEGVRFRITNLHEDPFKVGYVSGWEIGRSFSISGDAFPYANAEATKGEIVFKGRTTITVHPTDEEWFTKSRIGAATPSSRGGASMHIFLPWRVAHQILTDLRLNLDQVCDISISKDTDPKTGRVSWGIYQMELESAATYPFSGDLDVDD